MAQGSLSQEGVSNCSFPHVDGSAAQRTVVASWVRDEQGEGLKDGGEE